MPNTSQSSTRALQGSVISDLEHTSSIPHTEATRLSADRISSYVTDPDLSIPHTSIDNQHVPRHDAVATAVSRMGTKLQEFHATFYGNDGNGRGS
ncbi:hypothetical protein NHQ30_008181 [Ciborinia camelliae]|nr:hypothetical protein NHQ30_008181 [Ciborinia camelliae]